MNIQISSQPTADYFIPTAEWINGVQIGDMVPDCFGAMGVVVEISARDLNINGDPFICLHTRLSETSQISGSFTAGKLHRSMKICGRHTSHELTLIERNA